MDVNQLKYFKKAAELQHITRAAEELHITQAALSQSLHNLEKELGVVLFEHSGRNVSLSRYGIAYLEYAAKAIGALDRAEKVMREMKHDEDNSVALITPTLFGFQGLFPIICEKSDGFKISVLQKAYYQIPSALKSGEADLCITQRPLEELELQGIKLRSFKLGILVAADSPFARKERLSLEELRTCEFVSFNTDQSQRMNLQELCEKGGWSPNITLEVGHYADVVRAVSTGRYIAVVVPAIHENYGNDGVQFLELEGTDPEVTLWLYWDRTHRLKPLAKTLKMSLTEYFNDDSNFMREK